IDPGNIAVLLGAGDGTFAAPLTFETGSGPRSLAIADIDDDGKPDIVTPDFFDFTTSLLFNNSQSSATLHTTINVTTTNDAPDVTATAMLATVPSVPLSLNGVVFADVDGGAAGQTEIATFTAAAGTGVFTATAGGGVAVTGDNTETLTLTGSIADLNT